MTSEGLSSLRMAMLWLCVLMAVAAEPLIPPLSPESRRIAVDMHNKYRSMVAQGMAPNRFAFRLPAAAKMRKVGYSSELELLATEMAAHCDLTVHSKATDHVDNFAVYTLNGVVTQEKAMFEGVKKWFDELTKVGVNELQFTKATAFGVRHFTQLVWETVEEIGCAVNFCKFIKGSALNGIPTPKAFVVCEYRPKGNKYGHYIYEAGTPCSQCVEYANCRCENSTNLCHNPTRELISN